jgi:hypothetical protein
VSWVALRTAPDGSVVADYGKNRGTVLFGKNGHIQVFNAQPGLSNRINNLAHFTRDLKSQSFEQYDACSNYLFASLVSVATGAETCAPVIDAAVLGGPAVTAGVALACIGYAVGDVVAGWNVGVECVTNGMDTEASWHVSESPDEQGVLIGICESGGCSEQAIEISENNVPDGNGVSIDGDTPIPGTSVETYPGGFEEGSYCAECIDDGIISPLGKPVNGDQNEEEDDPDAPNFAECLLKCF